MNQEHQDDIQENTDSMEEKLEALADDLSLCCGSDKTDYGFCSDCHENC